MKKKEQFKKEIGITLIALVITIVVLLILAGVSIATLTGNNGILTRANEAEISTELAEYKEQLDLYKVEKYAENANFIEETLTAGKENLSYNTQKTGETGNIKTIISNISEEYLEKLEVIKGELLINTKDEQEIKIAQGLGIEVNPYDITEDGELLSSNGNLLLMDKTTGTLIIPDTVTAIGEGAFANLEGLKTVIIPGTVKRIERDAFRNNKDLENVILQDGVEYIGESAFQNCTKLKNVEMPNSVTEIKLQAFYGDRNLSNINLSTGLKVIESYVFGACINLNMLEIPEGITNIKESAFSNCSNLQKVKISKTVKEIYVTAFTDCPKLQNIEIAEGNTNFQFEKGILLGNNKTEMIIILESAIEGNKLIIPNTVTKLSSRQIEQYTNITTIEIPESVTEIAGTFITDYITNVIIDSSNPKYETDGKAIYTKDDNYKELVRYYANENNVTVREGIKNIKNKAFQNEKLSSIELPESLEKIENEAFSGCNNLKSLTLGTNVNSLNNMSIYNSSIEKIEFVKNEKGEENPNYSIKNGVLYNKEGTIFISPIKPVGTITTYEIPEGTKEIANLAFHNQNKMTNIALPNTIEKIGDSFNYCNSLTSIEIPSSVTSIGTGCFAEASNLKEIRIHKTKGSIAGSPWRCIYGDRAIIWDE